MARPRSTGLTDAELRIMDVLWARGRATVGDVVDAIPARPKPAYNTTLTILRILERKGYVTHEQEGRAYTFIPLVDRGQERRRALSHILTRFFDDSPRQLVSDLLGHEALGDAELQRVREIVDRLPEEPRPRRRKR